MATQEIVTASKRDLALGAFELSATGLRYRGKGAPTMADLEACGERLGRMEGSIQWWIGDWANLVPKQGGEHKEAVRALCEGCGLQVQSVRNCAQVCRNVLARVRFPALRFEHHRVVAKYPPEDQRRWLQAALEGDGDGKPWTAGKLKQQILLEKTRRLIGPAGTSVVHKADALEFLKTVPAESVDLILTDPPYATDVADIDAFAATWVPLAIAALKPTGRAYIFTGSYPHEVRAYLNALHGIEGFALDDLIWTYEDTMGPAPKQGYKRNHQMCWYLTGEEAPPLDCEILKERFTVHHVASQSSQQGARLDPWQKPDELAERFVRHASKPGDLILDPFVGTGTFLVAAAKLGRRGLGCEIDRNKLKLCRERGLSVKR